MRNPYNDPRPIATSQSQFELKMSSEPQESVQRHESRTSDRFNLINKYHTRILPKIISSREHIDDLPSQISRDEWGEVQKYSKILDQEQKQKEKQEYFHKQKQVKQTLDMQIRDQQLQKERLSIEKKEFDLFIIQNDRADLEKEKQKRDLIK